MNQAELKILVQARKTWALKLAHLEAELPIVSDFSKKFEIKYKIKECEEEIHRLDEKITSFETACNSDSENDFHYVQDEYQENIGGVYEPNSFFDLVGNVYAGYCRLVEYFNVAVWVSNSFILFILVLFLIIGSKNDCEAGIKDYDKKLVLSGQNNSQLWFQKGQKQYSCQAFFGDGYKNSFDKSLSSAKKNNETEIVRLFLNEAIKQRNSHDLDYSEFLIKRVLAFQPNFFEAEFELGETQRLRFEREAIETSKTVVEKDFFNEMNKLINESISHYNAALKQNTDNVNEDTNNLKAQIYKGYSLVLKGRFFEKYFQLAEGQPPLSDSEMEEFRRKEASRQYQLAINLFDGLKIQNSGNGDLLLAEAYALFWKKSTKEACTKFQDSLNLPMSLEITESKLNEIQENRDFTSDCELVKSLNKSP